jgi:hypothetical protein
MDSERDAQERGARLPALPRHPAAEELEDVRFTREICHRALPWEAPPEHDDRLRRIEGIVRWSLERR